MIRILTDSASDILPAEAAQLGVDVIPLNVTLEDGTVIRDGVDLTPSEYYEHMAGCKKLPTTSQPSLSCSKSSTPRPLPPETRSWASSCPMSCPAPISVRSWPQTWPTWTTSSSWTAPMSASARVCWCVWPHTCGTKAGLPSRSPPPSSTPRSTCTSSPPSTT